MPALPVEDPFNCGSDEISLNVLAQFSYHPPFAAAGELKDLAGSGYYKIDALTGTVLCRRERKVFGRAFNPERRDPSVTGDPLTWDVFWDLGDVTADLHTFEETVDIGSLEVAGRMDLAYTPQNLSPGGLFAKLDYLSGPPFTIRQAPSGGTFMLTDRFYTTRTDVTYYGNAVRIGNIFDNGLGVLEVVLTTNGGRLVTARLPVLRAPIPIGAPQAGLPTAACPRRSSRARRSSRHPDASRCRRG